MRVFFYITIIHLISFNGIEKRIPSNNPKVNVLSLFEDGGSK